MAVERFLGKDQLAVDRDLKNAAFGWDHFPGTDKLLDVPFLQDFSRQTDGAFGVVSNRTVFENDVEEGILHQRLLSAHTATDIRTLTYSICSYKC